MMEKNGVKLVGYKMFKIYRKMRKGFKGFGGLFFFAVYRRCER